ncbi:hypothetical protein PUMCH_002863 [Australozyma saopauloensis]|uniref:Uncharacterized protein n=1 Tax=Australozyma saopauloensis TaxID=291208 RepID=A0AAX4HAG6_9ASCO|nr:hypothetical protein PUMCH_002863 [[Candida] saopauloensis]
MVGLGPGDDAVQPVQPNVQVPNPSRPELAQVDENPELERRFRELSRSMLNRFAKDEGKVKCDDDYELLLRFLLEPPGMKLIEVLSKEPYDRKLTRLLKYLLKAKREGDAYTLPAKQQNLAIDLIRDLIGEVGDDISDKDRKAFLEPLVTKAAQKFLEGFNNAIWNEKPFLPQLLLTILESLNKGVIEPEHRAPPANPENQMQALVNGYAKTEFGSFVFTKLFSLPPSPEMIDIMKAISSGNDKAIELISSMATLMSADSVEDPSPLEIVGLVSTMSSHAGLELILSLYQPSTRDNFKQYIRDRYSSLTSEIPENTNEGNWPCEHIGRTSWTPKLFELDPPDSNECPPLSQISIKSTLKSHLVDIEDFENMIFDMIDFQLQLVIYKPSLIERKLVTVILYSVKDSVVAQTCFLRESYRKIFESLIRKVEYLDAVLSGELVAEHPIPNLQLGVDIYNQYQTMTEENLRKLEDLVKPNKENDVHLKAGPFVIWTTFQSCSITKLQLALKEFQMLTYSVLGGILYFESEKGWNRLDTLALLADLADVDRSDMNAPDEPAQDKFSELLATSRSPELFQERFINGKLFNHIDKSQWENWFVLLYLKMIGKYCHGPDGTPYVLN